MEDWKATQRRWAQITLERQAAERSSAEWAFYGVAAFIGVYLFTVAVLSLAHPY